MYIHLSEDQKSRWNIHNKISCIYKITNRLDGKIYIGQTIDLRKRVPQYNHPIKHSMRDIMNAMYQDGTDNFVLEIIEECDPEDLDCFESYHIRKNRSYDSDVGYNENRGISTRTFSDALEQRKLMSESHKGLTESPFTKRKKSNAIIAINEETQSVIISDSAKLFGDYVDKSKDYIKNCLRQPSTVQGYQLYYLDRTKRDENCLRILRSKKMKSDRFERLWDMLNACGNEGVETISSLLQKVYANVYYLRYGITDKDGEPKLIKAESAA